MASLKRKVIKCGKSYNEEMLGSMSKIEQKADTMDIDGITYFPCRTCNRLFKDEKLAMCHLKKCKPRVYLVSNEELGNENEKTEDKDPYEIIPEEIELEGQLVNNNSLNENKNGSGKFKWRKNSRQCNNYNESEAKKLDRTPSFFNKTTNSNLAFEPKKHIVQSVHSSAESDGFVSSTEQTILHENRVKLIEKQTANKKNTSNTEKRKRNYRQLTEEEIAERLKKISERLKKHKQPETINEEDEEEERRDIEERLSVLNKGSEVCIIQDGVEGTGARLTDKKFYSKASKQNVGNCQVGLHSTIFGDISGNNMAQEYMGSMQNMKNEILRFRKQSTLSPESQVDGVVIITQRPDGQLHSCRKCSQVFLSSLELLRHSRREHTYPKIIMSPAEISKFISLKDRSHCPICEKPLSSSYKSIYLKHLQTHSCVLEHICPICKKKFKRRDHMRAHQKRHIVGNNVESTELNRNGEIETEDLQ
ncbi:hypothetical protein WA026_021987 [Henosepilachna vigintioctopunctata]|uniref:C2H2-type domain-containing protein n=1 Tax=Henosepilachna vigintioctopunctata TaxID=420089 RepID=A0AAW1VDC4_9CUCU